MTVSRGLKSGTYCLWMKEYKASHQRRLVQLINMAAYQIKRALLCIIVFALSSQASRNTRVKVTSVGPVTTGGILAIQCEIRNMEETYKVNFFHDAHGKTEQITLINNNYAETSLGQRSYLAKRTFQGGSHVFFLTVVDVEYRDEGVYLCKVYSMENRRFNEIAEDSTEIRINSYPSKIYPSCQSSPSTASVTVGDRLVLKCISERTFPLVKLTWSSSSDSSVVRNNRNTTTNYEVSFEASLILQASHNGALFVCTMTSPGFPHRERSCMIGPLDIIQDSSNNFVSTKQVIGVDVNSPNEQSKTGPCNLSCSASDKFTLFYWAVVLVGTTILMIIFLTTTIIWCYKYHTISRDVTPPIERRSVTYASGDVVDPVYVSLQRRTEYDRASTYSTYVTRPEPDRSSTYSSYSSYMTVEDPSNPGNKVVMPKEVFDEFYRSLSLKKNRNREPKPAAKDAVIPLRM